MGRGSSSAGSKGVEKYAGGSSINPRNIKKLGDLHISQGAGEAEEVRAVNTVSRFISDTYGEDVATRFEAVEMKGKDANVLGFYDGKNISLNQAYKSDASMNAAYDECIAAGFHPSRGNKSGMEAVVAHEYGHALTDEVGRKMGVDNLHTAATRVVTEAKGNSRDFQAKISGYATTNHAETIAEAFSDVYCNGSKAKKESRAIMKVMNKYLNS